MFMCTKLVPGTRYLEINENFYCVADKVSKITGMLIVIILFLNNANKSLCYDNIISNVAVQKFSPQRLGFLSSGMIFGSRLPS